MLMDENDRSIFNHIDVQFGEAYSEFITVRDSGGDITSLAKGLAQMAQAMQSLARQIHNLRARVDKAGPTG